MKLEDKSGLNKKNLIFKNDLDLNVENFEDDVSEKEEISENLNDFFKMKDVLLNFFDLSKKTTDKKYVFEYILNFLEYIRTNFPKNKFEDSFIPYKIDKNKIFQRKKNDFEFNLIKLLQIKVLTFMQDQKILVKNKIFLSKVEKSLLSKINDLSNYLLKQYEISLNKNNINDITRKIFHTEKFWLSWKKDSCPKLPLKKSFEENYKDQIFKKRTSIKKAINQNNKTIKNWFNIKKIDFYKNLKRGFKSVN